MRTPGNAPLGLRRPSPKLLWYYLLQSLGGLVLQPLVFLPLYFRYHTLEYHFDEKGIRASWGLLFRHEVFLTYGRIQDIHVRRNLVERWLGLARVEVQTASANAGAELSIVGLEDFLQVRDFLYARMRGRSLESAAAPGSRDEVLETLHAIRDELRALRQEWEEARRVRAP